MKINQLPNRTVEWNGRVYLYFSGTAYLGLPQNSNFKHLVHDGLAQYGNVYGSSRNGNLQLSIYEETEIKLAAWTGSEAALTLSSGMLAGQVAVRQLMIEGYDFVYSQDVHPAVWHWPQINSDQGGSFEDWCSHVVQTSQTKLPTSKICFVTNAVDALKGKIYDFEWTKKLPIADHIVLLIDDSHGMGITGAEGRGVLSRLPQCNNVRVIVTASLAKAMGMSGGVVFSDATTLQKIRNSAYFGGCSPMSPHHLYAYLNADEIYAEAYGRLQANIRQFTKAIKDLDLFSFTEDYPVFYTDHDELYPFLMERGIIVYKFSYPKPTDKANTRIIISAWHTPEDILRLSDACRAFVDSYTLSL